MAAVGANVQSRYCFALFDDEQIVAHVLQRGLACEDSPRTREAWMAGLGKHCADCIPFVKEFLECGIK